jgi:hypothetical protein
MVRKAEIFPPVTIGICGAMAADTPQTTPRTSCEISRLEPPLESPTIPQTRFREHRFRQLRGSVFCRPGRRARDFYRYVGVQSPAEQSHKCCGARGASYS